VKVRPGTFCLFIPLPSLPFGDCGVRYQSKADGFGKDVALLDPVLLPEGSMEDGFGKEVAWLDPVLLPEESILLASRGDIRFMAYDVEYKLGGVDAADGGDAADGDDAADSVDAKDGRNSERH